MRLALALVVFTLGCAPLRTPPIGVDYGEPGEDWRSAAVEAAWPHVRDREASYAFGTPRPGFNRDGMLRGGEVRWVGWIVEMKAYARGRARIRLWALVRDGEARVVTHGWVVRNELLVRYADGSKLTELY